MEPLRKRRTTLKSEVARLQFATDYKELMSEYKVTYNNIAESLGISGIKARQLVNTDPLTIEDMTVLVDLLNESGTCRIVFVIPRP